MHYNTLRGLGSADFFLLKETFFLESLIFYIYFAESR